MRDLKRRGPRVFEAAATTGNDSRAAELPGLTRLAVLQQTRQLETKTGLRPFKTQARPIRLTTAGEALLHHTRVILVQVSVADDALSTLDGHCRGQLHVGVVSPSQCAMPMLPAACRQLQPDLRLKLMLGRRDALPGMMLLAFGVGAGDSTTAHA